MQTIMALFTALTVLSFQQSGADVDCTPTLDRYYPDHRDAMKEIEDIAKLHYVFQNHRHFFYLTLTSDDLLKYKLILRPQSRIVVTFELDGADLKDRVLSHSCHIFTDGV